jgi:hypothetical protein
VQPRPASAATGSRAASITVLASVRARCFSADWASRHEVEFPAAMSIGATREALQLTLQWDDRLFTVDDQVFAESPAGLQIVTTKSPRSGELRATLPAQTSAVYTSARPVDLYPADNIDWPKPTTVTVSGREHSEQVSREISTVPSEPWGAEVSAEWAVSAGYSYPTMVGVVSVGPNSVPAGSILTVRVFREVAALRIETDTFAVTEDGRSAKRSTEYVLEVANDIPAGETQTFQLTAPGNPDPDDIPSVAQVAYVALTSSASANATARSTGKYSIASVTPDGSLLSNYQRVESADANV